MSQSVLSIETGAQIAGHEVQMEASPYGIDKKKLGMWIFIVSDACTFATFLFGYGYMRIGNHNWGTPFEFSSILNGIIMTFILLSSSLSMLAVVRATQAGQKASANKWLGVTMLLGTVFAVLHLREWVKMIGEGCVCSITQPAARLNSARASSASLDFI